jgi:hypothetical protein
MSHASIAEAAAVEALRKLALSPDPKVIIAAVNGLVRYIHREDAVEVLRKIGLTSNQDVQIAVALALGGKQSLSYTTKQESSSTQKR